MKNESSKYGKFQAISWKPFVSAVSQEVANGEAVTVLVTGPLGTGKTEFSHELGKLAGINRVVSFDDRTLKSDDQSVVQTIPLPKDGPVIYEGTSDNMSAVMERIARGRTGKLIVAMPYPPHEVFKAIQRIKAGEEPKEKGFISEWSKRAQLSANAFDKFLAGKAQILTKYLLGSMSNEADFYLVRTPNVGTPVDANYKPSKGEKS